MSYHANTASEVAVRDAATGIQHVVDWNTYAHYPGGPATTYCSLTLPHAPEPTDLGAQPIDCRICHALVCVRSRLRGPAPEPLTTDELIAATTR